VNNGVVRVRYLIQNGNHKIKREIKEKQKNNTGIFVNVSDRFLLQPASDVM
jgi:hypothetical protein